MDINLKYEQILKLTKKNRKATSYKTENKKRIYDVYKNKTLQSNKLAASEDVDESKLNIKSKKEKLLHQQTKESKKPKKKKKKKEERIKGTVVVPLLKNIKLKVKKGDLIGIISEN